MFPRGALMKLGEISFSSVTVISIWQTVISSLKSKDRRTPDLELRKLPLPSSVPTIIM